MPTLGSAPYQQGQAEPSKQKNKQFNLIHCSIQATFNTTTLMDELTPQ